MVGGYDLKNVIAVVVGIVFCLLLILTVEAALHALYKQEELMDMKYADEYFFIDSHGITRAIPGGQYQTSSTSKKTGKKIYDVTYSIDKIGRRHTPVVLEKPRNNFLLFFGGSFTFGEGLEDNETIPYYSFQHTDDYMPYNYGFHGHSAAEMLIKLSTNTIPDEIKQKKGVLIYTFIDAHVIRVTGSMRVVTTWGRNRPYFYFDSEGRVVNGGDFESGRPVTQFVYEILSKSKMLEMINIDIPLKVTMEHVHLLTSIIDEARHSYNAQFPESRFYVLIYPGAQYVGMLKQSLEEKSIDYLDYSKLFSQTDPKYSLAYEDLHPSAYANQVMARKIVSDLGI
jgi:hypothetical protein